MPRSKILQDNRDYTFRSYFEMNYEPEEILAEFDYKLIRSRLSLPRTTRELDRLCELRDRIERTVNPPEIIQDITLYSLPDDLDKLMTVLVGITERT